MANNWQQTKKQIVNRGLRLAGVLQTGEDPGAAQFKDKFNEASDALHAMLLGMQSEFLSPFTITRSQSSFSESTQVSNDSTNYRCILSNTSSADNEPGTGADWTTYWVEDGDGSDGDWALGQDYTSKHQISLSADTVSVCNVFVRDGDCDYPVTVVSRQEYFERCCKSIESMPKEAFLDSQTTPILYLYPHPDLSGTDEQYVLHYDEIKIINDFDNSSDTGVSTGNFPLRWIETVQFKLGHVLAIEYQVPIERIRLLDGMSRKMLGKLKSREESDTVGSSVKPCI